MIKTKNDLVGRKFGYLTVIEQADDYVSPKGQHQIQWKCKCHCGNTVIVRGRHLLDDRTTSCGCFSIKKTKEREVDDLTGRRYSKLIVLARDKNRGRDTYWKCKCDCGNIISVYSSNLKQGKIKSCGCIAAKDLTNRRFGKLVAKNRVSNKKDNVMWHCICDCGCSVDVHSASLINGNTRSCGCLVSSGELLIGNILTDKRIDFVRQYSFDDCKDKKPLKFDFYLPKYNTCIEFQGKQHYKPIDYFGGISGFMEQIKRDKIKKEYCIENNISLIEIPYNQIKNIEGILEKQLFYSAT